MYPIDTSTAISPEGARPDAGTPGYFHGIDPGKKIRSTVVSPAWMNAVQNEIANVVSFSGLILDKTDDAQLLKALRIILKSLRVRAWLADRRPTASEKIGIPMRSGDTFAANFAGGFARCLGAPQAAWRWTVWKDAAQIGTVDFAAGSVTGAFTTVALTYAADGMLYFQAPAAQDLSGRGFAVLLKGVAG